MRLYKTFLQEKYPRVLASDLQTIESELQQDLSELDPVITSKVLERMYETNDQKLLPKADRYSELVKHILEF